VRVYRAVPSRRLVVLGRAGAGKTVLALRLLVGLLDGPGAEVARVPVVFSLASWDPTRQALRDWLIEQLCADYPFLEMRVRTGAGGGRRAAALVGAGRALPILDGFDEIADGWRVAALTALNEQEHRCPLVLTSRTEPYRTAVLVHGRPVVDAEAVC